MRPVVRMTLENNKYMDIELFDDVAPISVKNFLKLVDEGFYTDIVFHMMPKYFTLHELQLVFEAILGKKLLDPQFRREMKNKVIETDKYKNDGGHRPAKLYMYKGE